jgi:t-SNARE complex subunit (syntaxin)
MVMGKMRVDYNRLANAHETMRTSLQEQIVGLQAIHEEELARRDAALRTYKEEIGKIERRYEVNLESIKDDREDKYREYLHEFIRDPEQLAKDIEELFGFEYVE